MQWLQEPLYYIGLWDEYYGDGFFVEYLELMWAILKEMGPLEKSGNASSVLNALMRDPDIWQAPVAPAAILALCDIDAGSVDSILQTFLSAWKTVDGQLRYMGSPDINLGSTELASCAPLLSVACLHPRASLDLVRETARTCTESEPTRSELRVSFWEYVTGCLLPDRDAGDWWCPMVTWRDGFFANGLPAGSPAIGNSQLGVLRNFFIEASGRHDWSNVYGESTVVATALAALAEKS